MAVQNQHKHGVSSGFFQEANYDDCDDDDEDSDCNNFIISLEDNGEEDCLLASPSNTTPSCGFTNQETYPSANTQQEQGNVLQNSVPVDQNPYYRSSQFPSNVPNLSVSSNEQVTFPPIQGTFTSTPIYNSQPMSSTYSYPIDHHQSNYLPQPVFPAPGFSGYVPALEPDFGPTTSLPRPGYVSDTAADFTGRHSTTYGSQQRSLVTPKSVQEAHQFPQFSSPAPVYRRTSQDAQQGTSSSFSNKQLETVNLDNDTGGIWSEAVFLSTTSGVSDSSISNLKDRHSSSTSAGFPYNSHTPFYQQESSGDPKVHKLDQNKQPLATNVCNVGVQGRTLESNQSHGMASKLPDPPPYGAPTFSQPPQYQTPKLAGPFPRTSSDPQVVQPSTVPSSGLPTVVSGEEKSLDDKTKCTCIMCYTGRGIIDWYPEPALTGEEAMLIEGCGPKAKRRKRAANYFKQTALSYSNLATVHNQSKLAVVEGLSGTILHTQSPVVSIATAVTQSSPTTSVIFTVPTVSSSKYKSPPMKVFLKPAEEAGQKTAMSVTAGGQPVKLMPVGRGGTSHLSSSGLSKTSPTILVAHSTPKPSNLTPSSSQVSSTAYQILYMGPNEVLVCPTPSATKQVNLPSVNKEMQQTPKPSNQEMTVLTLPNTNPLAHSGNKTVPVSQNAPIVSQSKVSDKVSQSTTSTLNALPENPISPVHETSKDLKSVLYKAQKIDFSNPGKVVIQVRHPTVHAHCPTTVAKVLTSAPKETQYTTSLLKDIKISQGSGQSKIPETTPVSHVEQSGHRTTSNMAQSTAGGNLLPTPQSTQLEVTQTLLQLISSHLHDGSLSTNGSVLLNVLKSGKTPPSTPVLSPQKLQQQHQVDEPEKRITAHKKKKIMVNDATETLSLSVEGSLPQPPQTSMPNNYVEDWVRESTKYSLKHHVKKKNDFLDKVRNIDRNISSEISKAHSHPAGQVALENDDSRETLVLPRPKTLVQLLSEKPKHVQAQTLEHRSHSSQSPDKSLSATDNCGSNSPVKPMAKKQGHNGNLYTITSNNLSGEVKTNVPKPHAQKSIKSHFGSKMRQSKPSLKRPSSSLVACSKGIKLRIKLNEKKRDKVKAKKKRILDPLVSKAKSCADEVPQLLSKPCTQDSNSEADKAKTVLDSSKLNTAAFAYETAEEMFQRFQEQAMEEVFKAQLGVGYLSRSLRPTRTTMAVPDKPPTSVPSVQTKKKPLEEQRPATGSSKSETSHVQSTESQSLKENTGHKKQKSQKKRPAEEDSISHVKVKQPKLSIRDYPKMKQDDSITNKKKLICANILAGHKVYVKFNTYENVYSSRSFLVPFFNIGGSRMQFDVEDMEYISKAVVEFEKDERSCARHLLYFSREGSKATFLRKEKSFQTHQISENSYKKSSFILEGFKRESKKPAEPPPEQWKVDSTIAIEIDTAEIDNDTETAFGPDIAIDSGVLLQTIDGANECDTSAKMNEKSKCDTNVHGLVSTEKASVEVEDKHKDTSSETLSKVTVSKGVSQSHRPSILRKRINTLSHSDSMEDKHDNEASILRKMASSRSPEEPLAYTEKLQELLRSEVLHSPTEEENEEHLRRKILQDFTTVLSAAVKTEAPDDGYETSQNQIETGEPDGSGEPVLPEGSSSNFTGITVKEEPRDDYFDSFESGAVQSSSYQYQEDELLSTQREKASSNNVARIEVDDTVVFNGKSQSVVSNEILQEVENQDEDLCTDTAVATENEITEEHMEQITNKNADVSTDKAIAAESNDVSRKDVQDNNKVGEQPPATSGNAETSKSVQKETVGESAIGDKRPGITESAPSETMSTKTSGLDPSSPGSPPPSSSVSESSEIPSSSDVEDDGDVSDDEDDDDLSSEEEDQTVTDVMSSTISFTDMASPDLTCSAEDKQSPGSNKITSLVESLKQRLTQNVPSLPSWLVSQSTPVVVTDVKKKKKKKKKTKRNIDMDMELEQTCPVEKELVYSVASTTGDTCTVSQSVPSITITTELPPITASLSVSSSAQISGVPSITSALPSVSSSSSLPQTSASSLPLTITSTCDVVYSNASTLSGSISQPIASVASFMSSPSVTISSHSQESKSFPYSSSMLLPVKKAEDCEQDKQKETVSDCKMSSDLNVDSVSQEESKVDFTDSVQTASASNTAKEEMKDEKVVNDEPKSVTDKDKDKLDCKIEEEVKCEANNEDRIEFKTFKKEEVDEIQFISTDTHQANNSVHSGDSHASLLKDIVKQEVVGIWKDEPENLRENEKNVTSLELLKGPPATTRNTSNVALKASESCNSESSLPTSLPSDGDKQHHDVGPQVASNEVSQKAAVSDRVSPTSDMEIEVGEEDLPETLLTLDPILPSFDFQSINNNTNHKEKRKQILKVQDDVLSTDLGFSPSSSRGSSPDITQEGAWGRLSFSSQKKVSVTGGPKSKTARESSKAGSKKLSKHSEPSPAKSGQKGSVASYLLEKFSKHDDSSVGHKIRGPRLLVTASKKTSGEKPAVQKQLHVPPPVESATVSTNQVAAEPISTAELSKTPSLSEIFGIAVKKESKLQPKTTPENTVEALARDKTVSNETPNVKSPERGQVARKGTANGRGRRNAKPDAPATVKPTPSGAPNTVKPTSSNASDTVKPTISDTPETVKPTPSDAPDTVKPTSSDGNTPTDKEEPNNAQAAPKPCYTWRQLSCRARRSKSVENPSSSIIPCKVVLTRLEECNTGYVLGIFGNYFKVKEEIEEKQDENDEAGNASSSTSKSMVRRIVKRKKKKPLKNAKKTGPKPKRDIVDYYASVLESLQKKAQQLEEEEARRRENEERAKREQEEKGKLEKEIEKEVQGQEGDLADGKANENATCEEKEEDKISLTKKDGEQIVPCKEEMNGTENSGRLKEDEVISLKEKHSQDVANDTSKSDVLSHITNDGQQEEDFGKDLDSGSGNDDINGVRSVVVSGQSESQGEKTPDEATGDISTLMSASTECHQVVSGRGHRDGVFTDPSAIEKVEENASKRPDAQAVLNKTVADVDFEKKDIVLGGGVDTQNASGERLIETEESEAFLLGSSDDLDEDNVGFIPQDEVEKLLGLDIPEGLPYGLQDSDIGSRNDNLTGNSTSIQSKHSVIDTQNMVILQDTCTGSIAPLTDQETKSGVRKTDIVQSDITANDVKSAPDSLNEGPSSPVATSLAQPSGSHKNLQVSPSWKRILGKESLEQMEQSILTTTKDASSKAELRTDEKPEMSSASFRFKLRIPSGTVSKALRLSKEMKNVFGEAASEGNSPTDEENVHPLTSQQSEVKEQIPSNKNELPSEKGQTSSQPPGPKAKGDTPILKLSIPKLKLNPLAISAIQKAKVQYQQSKKKARKSKISKTKVSQGKDIQIPDAQFIQDMQFYLRDSHNASVLSHRVQADESQILYQTDAPKAEKRHSDSTSLLSCNESPRVGLATAGTDPGSTSEPSRRITRSRKTSAEVMGKAEPSLTEEAKGTEKLPLKPSAISSHAESCENTKDLGLNTSRSDGIFSKVDFLQDPVITPTVVSSESIERKTSTNVRKLLKKNPIDIGKLKMKLNPILSLKRSSSSQKESTVGNYQHEGEKTGTENLIPASTSKLNSTASAKDNSPCVSNPSEPNNISTVIPEERNQDLPAKTTTALAPISHHVDPPATTTTLFPASQNAPTPTTKPLPVLNTAKLCNILKSFHKNVGGASSSISKTSTSESSKSTGVATRSTKPKNTGAGVCESIDLPVDQTEKSSSVDSLPQTRRSMRGKGRKKQDDVANVSENSNSTVDKQKLRIKGCEETSLLGPNIWNVSKVTKPDNSADKETISDNSKECEEKSERSFFDCLSGVTSGVWEDKH